MQNQNIQTEVDASFLYGRLADHERDANVANVFREMSGIERGHAEAFATKNNIPLNLLPPPSWRAKILDRIGKTFGYDYVLGVLMDTEKSISNALVVGKNKQN